MSPSPQQWFQIPSDNLILIRTECKNRHEKLYINQIYLPGKGYRTQIQLDYIDI